MAYGQHETTLSLCSVAWDNRYLDVPYFTSTSNQFNYFANRGTWFTIDDDFRFIDGACMTATVRVNGRPEKIQGYNYAVYDNNDPTGLGKVYCFLTEVKSINYEVCELTLEVDVIQTYMFRYQFGYSTTERRMVTTDNRYHWGIKEDLADIANYVTSGGSMLTRDGTYPYICVREVIDYTDSITEWGIEKLNRTDMGSASVPYSFIICETDSEVANIIKSHQTSADEHHGIGIEFNMDNFISIGHVSKALFNIPHVIIDDSVAQIHRLDRRYIYGGHSQPYTLHSFSSYADNVGVVTRFSKMSWLQDSPHTPSQYGIYYPDNEKLLSDEFCTLEIENIGTKSVFNLDDFSSNTIDFEVSFSFSDTFHMYLSPLNSGIRGANVTDYNAYIDIPIAFTLPVTTNDYYAWLNAHNVELQTKSENINIGVAMGLITAIGSVALASSTGGTSLLGLGTGASAVTQGILSHREMKKEIESMKSQNSYTERGAIGDSFLLLGNNKSSRWNFKQIDPRRVKVIDHYLSRNGYKMETYEIPQINIRQNWNYLKTRNCEIKPNSTNGFMTNDIKLKIQSIYDTGIRFWNDPTYIGDFSHYEYLNPVNT